MFFLAPLLAGIAGAVGTAASIVGSVGAAGLGAAGAIGSAALGTAGAVGSAALGTAGAIGGAAIGGITSAVGGLGTLATTLKPAADLFGAVYGTMSSIEQVKAQKEAQSVAEKQVKIQQQAQAAAQKQTAAQAPIETYASQMLGQGAATTAEAAQAEPGKGGVIEQLGPYLPLLAIGIVGILLLKSRK